ncbi:3281_t:CDS:10 [Cetraspora pellucida]|uniref:tRNA pseudouridine(55) synthase n=1 Tax=Cetraspora pellucida TaxID=1433469 RepID=A0A9N9D0S7_9GLOM|nr:3281_t:CDS:10 [Cetraspora pellucida]
MGRHSFDCLDPLYIPPAEQKDLEGPVLRIIQYKYEFNLDWYLLTFKDERRQPEWQQYRNLAGCNEMIKEFWIREDAGMTPMVGPFGSSKFLRSSNKTRNSSRSIANGKNSRKFIPKENENAYLNDPSKQLANNTPKIQERNAYEQATRPEQMFCKSKTTGILNMNNEWIGCLEKGQNKTFLATIILKPCPGYCHDASSLHIFDNQQIMIDGFMEAENFINLMGYHKLVEWFKSKPKFMEFSTENNIHSRREHQYNFIPHLMKLKDLPNCKFIGYGNSCWPFDPSIDLEEWFLHGGLVTITNKTFNAQNHIFDRLYKVFQYQSTLHVSSTWKVVIYKNVEDNLVKNFEASRCRQSLISLRMIRLSIKDGMSRYFEADELFCQNEIHHFHPKIDFIMSKKRLWETDHDLTLPTRIPDESDKWKRIRCDEISQDIENFYEDIVKQISCYNNNDAIPIIIDTMLNSKCCARCILRFLNVHDYNLYSASEEVLLKLIIRIREDSLKSIDPKLTSSIKHSFTETFSCEPQDKPICVTCFDLLYQADTIDDLKVQCSLAKLVDLKEIFKPLLGWGIEKQTGLIYKCQSQFNISIEYYHEETQRIHMFLTKIPSAGFGIKKTRVKGKHIRTGDSRPNITNALQKVSDEEFLKMCYNCPPTVKERWKHKPPILEHATVYVGGRYNKFSRDISQTPWIINGVKLAPTSVSECIGEKIRELLRCDDYNFVPAGREDSNVRMLGDGRPFFMEIINPRNPFPSQEALNTVQEEVNKENTDLVRCHRLTMITNKQDLSIIKEGEETKTKTYSALVWISKKVTSEIVDEINKLREGLTIEQQTPIRVLHRRSPAVRTKKIHYIFAEQIEDNFLTLKMKTEAGTYVKEFIHGDLGRTVPNLGDIIRCHADILTLDVLEVDLKWPIQ